MKTSIFVMDMDMDMISKVLDISHSMFAAVA